MYSNERRSGFSIADLLVKIIFAALFIFILIWLFEKKVPNMTPFYSNVFRENIKYMQEAGESYFTDDKMPKNIGESTKISLGEMFDKRLLLPFVDENGHSCNQYDSYVSVTKTDIGYELKTNLVCNNESNFTIKILGCHTYCKDNSCNKTCRIEKITEYQFKKTIKTTKTVYNCDNLPGSKRNGAYCYKSKLIDSKPAKTTTTDTKVVTEPAVKVLVNGRKEQLETIKTRNNDTTKIVYDDKIYVTTGGGTTTRKECKMVDKTVPYECTKTKTERVPYTCTKTKTEKVSYSCTKYKTERKCTTTTTKQPYSCAPCTTYRDSNGISHTTCATCYKNVTTEKCNNVQVPYTDTCYRNETVSYNDTCYRNETVSYKDTCYKTVQEEVCKNVEVENPSSGYWTCPSISTNRSGSGENLKCWHTETVSGGYSYSCPSKANYSEGSGKNLKCYYVTDPTYKYECKDKSYTYNDSNKTCSKRVTSTITAEGCPRGYKQEGSKCNKYSTTKVKANTKKITSTSYKYMWSKSESVDGWTKTGKTRTVDGKEICE